MDPSYPSIGQDGALLNGDVGRIGCCGEGWSTPNEGLVVVNSVGTSYRLPGLAMTSGIEDDVLIHIQGFVGKADVVLVSHDRG